MNARRILGSVLATALAAASLSVVATAAPAAAAETVQTRIVPSGTTPVFSSYKKQIQYGDSISVSINVEAFVAGAWKKIYNGNVSVTQRVVGSSTAKRVAASSPGNAWIYDSIPAVGKAVYTVSYGGGTGEYPAVNYAPTSATYSIGNVQRKLTASTYSGRSTGVKGKLAPAKKLKITIFKKHGRKFKKYKVVRTNGKGRFKVGLPAPRRGNFFWKITFAGDAKFNPTTVKVKTYKL